MDDIGTFWIGGEMVLHEAEDAVYASSVEAALVEGFGFFELTVALIGRGGEVDASDGEMLQMYCPIDLSCSLPPWSASPSTDTDVLRDSQKVKWEFK